MTGTIVTGSTQRLLQDGVKKVFYVTAKDHKPVYSRIYKVGKSSKAYEVDVQVEGMGLASVKNEADDIVMDSFRQSFAPKYVPVAYGKGFQVSREARDDNQYGLYNKGARMLARAMNVTKEVRTHVLLNTAFSTASAMTGGDGLAMCSTAHINGPSGGTFSNRLAVDADFSQASLEDMLKLIMRATDDRCLAKALMPKKLVGHTDNKFEFERVLYSDLQSNTAENAKNVVKGTFEETVLSPWLTADTDAWFILTDAEDGLQYYDRTPLEFDQDMSFLNEVTRYKAYMRFVTGYSDPRGIYGSSGA